VYVLPALLFALLQASPQADRLWLDGLRLEALERMSSELEARPENVRLRTLLVQRELQAARFLAALEHSQGLPEDELGLRGRALYFLTRYEESLVHLGEVDPEELLMRAEALRALGRLAQVEQLLPSLRAVLGKDNPQVRLIEARGALRRGEFDHAIRLLRPVLRTQPLESEALFALGRALVRKGERDEGLRLLQQHRALVPLLDALDFARRGVALSPRRAPNLAALGDAWRELVVFDAAAAEHARKAYADALSHAAPEELAPVALRAARFRRDTMADITSAIALLEETITRNGDVRLLVRAADYLTQTGETARALSYLRKAIKQRPKDRAIHERIERLEDAGGVR
jgi:tetratricopeptide (TPR) repeat protein